MTKRKQEVVMDLVRASSSFGRKFYTSEWNLRKVFSLYLMEPQELFETLVESHLLHKDRICSKCGNLMKITITSEEKNKHDRIFWYCPRPCRSRLSIRKDTWFGESRLTIPEVVQFTYMWWNRYDIRHIKQEMKFGDHVLTDWANLCREVCILAVATEAKNLNSKVGGPGKEIEIGESELDNPRPGVGRFVIGGVERGSQKSFIVAVDDKSEQILRDVIYEWVEKGTIIYSTQSSYSFLQFCPEYRFRKGDPPPQNSAKPVPETNSQNSEDLSQGKRKSWPAKPGRRKQHFTGYIAAEMLQKGLAMDASGSNFAEFLKMIGRIYTPQQLSDDNDFYNDDNLEHMGHNLEPEVLVHVPSESEPHFDE